LNGNLAGLEWWELNGFYVGNYVLVYEPPKNQKSASFLAYIFTQKYNKN
jgi:hypothetical protein